MILTCPVPETINNLFANTFIFSVLKLPELTFFVQDVTFPGMTLGEAMVSSPLVDYPEPGDKIQFEALTVSFLIDERFKNYKAVSDWMLALGYPVNHTQFSNFVGKQTDGSEHLKTVSDATLGILDSSNNTLATYTFVDCFPISVGGFQYSSKETDARTLSVSVTFAFSYYTLQTKYDV